MTNKTALDEFGMGGTGTTCHTGVVTNPWDKTRMCAGSSSGSAAAVAAGVYPYATGSDTGDSIRKPAAYCGIVGYKPTYGMISRYGLFPFASSLDHLGVLTRCVKDAAIVVDEMKGIDKNDMTSWDSSDIHLRKSITGNVTGKKLCYVKEICDINNYPRSFYIKRFGNVMGNDIFDKANGIYFPTIKELNSRVHEKSMSMSQILYRDYSIEEAILIIKEMNDMLNVQLKEKKLTTRLIHLSISYSRDLYKSFNDTTLLNTEEDNGEKIFETLKYMYYKNIEDLPIRKVGIAYSKLSDKGATQLSLFDKNEVPTDEYNKIIDKITSKYGNTSILRASSLLKSSTIKNRERYKNTI